MVQIQELEHRFAAALQGIEKALAERRTEVPQGAVQSGETAEALQRENSELRRQLAELGAMREKDVATLDDLIAQLKPLIEEA